MSQKQNNFHAIKFLLVNVAYCWHFPSLVSQNHNSFLFTSYEFFHFLFLFTPFLTSFYSIVPYLFACQQLSCFSGLIHNAATPHYTNLCRLFGSIFIDLTFLFYFTAFLLLLNAPAVVSCNKNIHLSHHICILLLKNIIFNTKLQFNCLFGTLQGHCAKLLRKVSAIEHFFNFSRELFLLF